MKEVFVTFNRSIGIYIYMYIHVYIQCIYIYIYISIIDYHWQVDEELPAKRVILTTLIAPIPTRMMVDGSCKTRELSSQLSIGIDNH